MDYPHRVTGKDRINLTDFDPKADGGLKRAQAEQRTALAVEELSELQELLYAAGRQSVLVVLQGRDTSGKDGVIRHVMGPLNSQACEVASFKVPTLKELSHDFLWRIHLQTPAKGHIKVFNRSHYEDVLVVRVHSLVKEDVWQGRYAHINNFERMLSDSGTIIVKFYLHISKDEQKKRLLERESDTTKSWKLAVGDWQERELWDDYSKAYQDVLSKCSAEHAPWLIVPADRKWFRNLAVAEALRDALRPYRESWLSDLKEMGRRQLKAIEEYRRAHGEEV